MRPDRWFCIFLVTKWPPVGHFGSDLTYIWTWPVFYHNEHIYISYIWNESDDNCTCKCVPTDNGHTYTHTYIHTYIHTHGHRYTIRSFWQSQSDLKMVRKDGQQDGWTESISISPNNFVDGGWLIVEVVLSRALRNRHRSRVAYPGSEVTNSWHKICSASRRSAAAQHK